MSTLDQFDIYVTLLLICGVSFYITQKSSVRRLVLVSESSPLLRAVGLEDVGRADGVRGGQGQGQAPAHGHH